MTLDENSMETVTGPSPNILGAFPTRWDGGEPRLSSRSVFDRDNQRMTIVVFDHQPATISQVGIRKVGHAAGDRWAAGASQEIQALAIRSSDNGVPVNQIVGAGGDGIRAPTGRGDVLEKLDPRA